MCIQYSPFFLWAKVTTYFPSGIVQVNTNRALSDGGNARCADDICFPGSHQRALWYNLSDRTVPGGALSDGVKPSSDQGGVLTAKVP